MPEESGGTSPPDPGNNNNQDQASPSANAARSNKKKKNRNRGSPRTPRFKGKCEELEGYVYDTGLPHSNQDLFTNTTKEIAEYVAREYDNAREFRVGLVELNLPDPEPPARPNNDANVFVVEEWKEDFKEYRAKMKAREANKGKVFPLILGQCSRTICDRIEASDDWETVSSEYDVIGLLTLIRQSLYNRATTRKSTHTLIDAEAALH